MNEIRHLFKSQDVFVRVLTTSDAQNLEVLCQAGSDYFEMVEGAPAEPLASQTLFTDLPEGKSYMDKYLLGIFSIKEDELIGVIDLIRDYPIKDEWIIGLMLLNPKLRSKKIGAEVYKSLANWCALEGAKSMRIGVLQDNVRGLRFWQSMGFKEFERKPVRYGKKDHTVILMRCLLKADITEGN